ncbi:hypothetical protein [Ensifer adhaerens]|uniref:hypothetical protein n=1 Tax=Ensifer adhaerens TaxID=106592 RepID=UPI00128F8B5F|nr:hypothetical protein [Ensifer adhaerens]
MSAFDPAPNALLHGNFVSISADAEIVIAFRNLTDRLASSPRASGRIGRQRHVSLCAIFIRPRSKGPAWLTLADPSDDLLTATIGLAITRIAV